MKKIIASIALLGLLTSCSNSTIDQEPSNEMNYSKSLAKWTELKAVNGNSYTYKSNFTSFTGNGNTTQLTVKNGIVTAREYESFSIDNSPSRTKTITLYYLEDEKNLGTHTEGAPTITIDEIYTLCATNYLKVDETNNSITFTTLPSGLLNVCGYTPKNCMDDCFVGVNISDYKWVK
ncbi:hypothetical protein FFWV33_18815 [Flavobacterium faecale]|uniref:Lipocalin-like domain-containing protein n=1 Tax=Flavobacterium faecale TaxID=1355330 RepID=A0A2S1LI21_9FLAO|nr:hypothetical protein [Flavobacterium faecale]AWG23435.1 hypothetical protein FFWV33_18815 [Flavobacterium faecale]